jgi:phosphoglucosamine mutase
MPLSSLASGIELYPQILINVPVKKRTPLDAHPEIQGEIDKAVASLKGRGRVLVRPSGTEPKIRVMIEGQDGGLIKQLGNSIAEVIREKMA